MERLARQARELFNVHLTGRQILALAAYERELMEWNRKFNLTAIRDAQSIRTKHFLDSLSCLLVLRSTPVDRVIDVGTGAGLARAKPRSASTATI